MSKLNQVLQKLGIAKNESLVKVSDEGWRNLVPYRLQKGLEEINPDAIYLQGSKPLILFFDSNTIDEKEVSTKIWNLGGIPIVIFIKKDKISIHNGFLFDPEKSLFKKLEINNKKVNIEQLNLWDIISGKVWHELSKAKKASKVDEHLLNNIQDAQRVLVENSLDSTIANNLIGRLLFSRYLLDRGVIIDKQYFSDKQSFLNIINNKESLYRYFDYLKSNFNGDLFPLSKGEKNNVTKKHLDVLHSLFRGDKISTGQMSLFSLYDFKIIPIELISEVYERFIGKDNQRKEGAYYTPTFLVDYILVKTVRLKLQKCDDCRVLDPSCGSGIFLVESLRCIIEKKRENGEKLSKVFLKKAVKENIFGVDKDENAVNLSIFSLYLTLLDYQDPKDISKFKFPHLKNKNIFISDYFDRSNTFNSKLKNIKFDFILGNPPWKSDPKGELQIDYYKQEGIPVSDFQIAQTFTARAKDFSSENTKCALILTSKIFYNHEAEGFRKYLLNNFFIDEILEMSPVRKHLFNRATAPSTIVFYHWAADKDTSIATVVHTSIKPNIFLKYLGHIVIEKNDIKEIQQEYFLKYDWLWKVMLYGNVFDFYFIKKLKDVYKDNIGSLITAGDVVFGAGFIAGKKNQKKMNELSEMVFVQADDVESYRQKCHFIKVIDQFPDLRFKDKGVLEAYSTPHILLKRSLRDRPILTYLESDCAFPNTVFGIHSKDKNLLKAIGAYLSSNLIRYFLFLTSTTWGVEREEVLQKEYKMIPFVCNKQIIEKLAGMFNEILLTTTQKYNNNNILTNDDWSGQVESKTNNINAFLAKQLNLNNNEMRLIQYAVEVSIPLFFDEGDIRQKTNERQLREYAEVFTDYFGKKWDGKDGKYFEVDIYKNNFIVGINFKVTSRKSDTSINFKNNGDIFNSLYQALNLGSEKITEKFFLQRDARGFQENSFYVIKPNEYKNWHPAVAQIDFHEFINDMLVAEFKVSKKQ